MSKKYYMCGNCGVHEDNRSDWCGAGCGRDYSEMIEVKGLHNLLTQQREEVTKGHKHICAKCGDEFWTAHYVDTDKPLCNICWKDFRKIDNYKDYETYLQSLDKGTK